MIQCINYEVCGEYFLEEVGDHPRKNDYYCISCSITFDIHNPHRFEIVDDGDVCNVCYEKTGRKAKFPWCGHYLCCKCMKEIMYVDETKFEKTPTEFGCPPCPNAKCDNNDNMCRCEEYQKVIDEWMYENVEEWKDWIAHNVMQVEEARNTSNRTGDSRGSLKCPMCRKGRPTF